MGRREQGVIVGLVLAACLPFSGKAFHVDDPMFLAVAENVLRTPLEPFAGAVALDNRDLEVFREGGVEPNTFETMSHPPLLPYFLAGVATLAGGFRERALHIGYVVFPLLAALSAARLAKRLTDQPLFATLLLVSSPIYVLTSQSLMTDMPMLGLGLAAVAAFVEGVDSGSRRALLSSGILAGLAMVTRYVALGLLPLLAAYAVLFGRGRLRKASLACGGIALVLGAWTLQNILAHGSLHLVASSRHYLLYYETLGFGSRALAKKALYDLAAIGGTAFLPALLLLRGPRRIATGALCVGVAAWVTFGNPLNLPELSDYTAWQRAAVASCLGGGLFLVAQMARIGVDSLRGGSGGSSPEQPRERLFLCFWFFGALAAGIVFLPFGAARYLLPVLPPLAFALTAGEGRPSAAARVLPLAVLAATFGLSLGLAVADFDAAAGYRQFAKAMTAKFPGRGMWFVGDWGFRYYMEREGHRYLRSTDVAPRQGDIIVTARVAGLHGMASTLKDRTVLLLSPDLESRFPLRLLSHDARAGFYSHGWGFLPFAFSRYPLERFEIFQVTANP